MKKHLFTVALALTSLFSAFSQSIPNGGFESWNVMTFENPMYWFTSNAQNNSWGTGPINVIKVTDSYSNSFAVKLTTMLSGSDTAGAYIANGDPGKPAGQGIPYNQQASGLQFHYKCNVMSGDTALVLVMFKKAASVIGFYVKKITGSQPNYTLGTMGFSLAQAPDTIIFAATCSNLLANNFNGIPGSMLQLDSVRFTGVSSQPTNFNGDFELWQTQTSKTPVGWNISSATSPGNFQTTDAYAGSYALELKTNFNQGSARVDDATTGISTPGMTLGGYPFSNQNDTLIFYYKYAPGNPNDSAHFTLGFKKNGSYFANIGGWLPASSVYKQSKTTINLGMTPDTLVVFLEPSKTWSVPVSYVGASFKVDNMYLTSQIVPVTAMMAPPSGCTSQSLQLTDNSSNLPTSWTWTVSGVSTPTYSAQNPVVTFTAPGTYTIMHNASNSYGSGSVVTQTIAINATPSLTISGTNTLCAGTPATLFGSGASSYNWSTGATGFSVAVTPGATITYTLMGTSAGCSNMITKTISVTPLPNIITTAPSSVCSGSNACLAASGASSYMWAGPCGFTSTLASPCIPVSMGCGCTFSVTGTTAGCSKTNTLCISINPTPSVSAATSNSIICGPPFAGTATLSAAGAVSYTWNPGGTGSSIAVSPSVTTSYTVTGADSFGCMGNSVITQSVSACTGINGLVPAVSFEVYPNPNNGSFIIRSSAEEKIVLTDELGRHVQTVVLGSETNYTAEVKSLENGIYFASGKAQRFKIVVLK